MYCDECGEEMKKSKDPVLFRLRYDCEKCEKFVVEKTKNREEPDYYATRSGAV
jgi:hypothetical protein